MPLPLLRQEEKEIERNRLNHFDFSLLLKPETLKVQGLAILFDDLHHVGGYAVGDGGLNFERDLDATFLERVQVLNNFLHDFSGVACHPLGSNGDGAVEAL